MSTHEFFCLALISSDEPQFDAFKRRQDAVSNVPDRLQVISHAWCMGQVCQFTDGLCIVANSLGLPHDGKELETEHQLPVWV